MALSRRDFFVRTLQGAALISIPTVFASFLEGCKDNIDGPTGSGLQTVDGTLAGNIITVNVDSSSPLAKTGGAAIVKYSSGTVLVDHPSDNVYYALSPICTHQGCTIDNYDTGTSNFVCTCHNSRFNTDGKVAAGPASIALTQYATQFAGSQLKITIA